MTPRFLVGKRRREIVLGERVESQLWGTLRSSERCHAGTWICTTLHSINILLQSDWFSAMQVPYTVCHEHSSLSTCAQVLPPASSLLPCPCKSFSHFKSQLKTLTAISFTFSSPISYFCSPKRQYEAFEQFNFPLYRKSPLLYISLASSIGP